jgi:hypothetical protein
MVADADREGVGVDMIDGDARHDGSLVFRAA